MADAEAICEAVGRPNMRFVARKTVEQQVIISVHRARQGYLSAHPDDPRRKIGRAGCREESGAG
jgi:LPS sulfotransferase NodH